MEKHLGHILQSKTFTDQYVKITEHLNGFDK